MNIDGFRKVRYEVRVGILHGLHYHSKVAAEIYGKLVYITEAEVRALQILAKRRAAESEESFLEFCENVIIYSGSAKRSSKHIMMFAEDGSFINDFEDGFLDVNTKLALEIL